jgi:hypothetical protein
VTIFRRVVNHKEQRYETVGDWWCARPDMLMLTVSKMKDPRYQLLVGWHEQLEAELCLHAGISEEDVTAFDVAYEESRRLKLDRAPCGCKHRDEPGDDPHAPYREQHKTAMACEKILAKSLHVDWEKYADALEKL